MTKTACRKCGEQNRRGQNRRAQKRGDAEKRTADVRRFWTQTPRPRHKEKEERKLSRKATLRDMDVGLVLKVAGIGMIVTVACQILNKAGRDEQATLVSLAGIVIVLLMLVTEIGELFNTVRGVFGI